MKETLKKIRRKIADWIFICAFSVAGFIGGSAVVLYILGALCIPVVIIWAIIKLVKHVAS